MAENNIFNAKDTMDINELASLNDEISPELIEQLQQKLAQDAVSLSNVEVEEQPKAEFNVNDDTTLFEEPTPEGVKNEESETKPVVEEPVQKEKKEVGLPKNFDDNFIKKYKARLNKQQPTGDPKTKEAESSISNVAFSSDADKKDDSEAASEQDIEKLSNGKISKHKLTEDQKNYNNSLDFLDGNVKYSKYVIYIDPQNVDFIDKLTVKERKNLINRILREQDDISITKHRFSVINTIIKHVIVSIITITISIPIIYYTINASLEATINNYRRSQSTFQTLYKEKGKISNIKK